jgi:Domain of unknown function (DUF4326)
MKITQYPKRIQLKRTKGFNLQKVSQQLNELEAVKVARPTKFGNPYIVNDDGFSQDHDIPIYELITVENAVELFQDYLIEKLKTEQNFLVELSGKNLACFCRLDQPCHADILLDYANRDSDNLIS